MRIRAPSAGATPTTAPIMTGPVVTNPHRVPKKTRRTSRVSMICVFTRFLAWVVLAFDGSQFQFQLNNGGVFFYTWGRRFFYTWGRNLPSNIFSFCLNNKQKRFFELFSSFFSFFQTLFGTSTSKKKNEVFYPRLSYRKFCTSEK